MAAAFVVSRMLLLAISGVIALRVHASPTGIWRQWDGWWYIGIAERGYAWSFHGHSALAFFPLFPLLLHALAVAKLPVTIGGLAIANGSFFAALLYLHALMEQSADAGAARRSIWLLAFFPTAFFTFAPYTEPIFLLAATATLYHASRGQTALAGLWIAAALATRSTAVVLFVPAMLLVVQNQRAIHGLPPQLTVLRKGPRPRSSAFREYGAPLAWLAIPAGVASLAYFLYLASHGIHAAAIFSAQRSWHRSVTWPWTGFIDSINWPFRHLHTLWPSVVETCVSFGSTLAMLLLTRAAWPRLRWPERWYCLGFWTLVLCTPEWRDGYFAPFSSVDRFVLVLFPLAGWAAIQLSDRTCLRVVAAEAVGLVACASAFLAGTWIG